MTADLELWLRGLFVNRWRCPHAHVRQFFDPARFFYRYICDDCGCVASLDGHDVEQWRASSRHRPELSFVSHPNRKMLWG